MGRGGFVAGNNPLVQACILPGSIVLSCRAVQRLGGVPGRISFKPIKLIESPVHTVQPGCSSSHPSRRSSNRPSQRSSNRPSRRSSNRPSQRSSNRPSQRSSNRPSQRSSNRPSRRSSNRPSHRSSNRPSRRSSNPPSLLHFSNHLFRHFSSPLHGRLKGSTYNLFLQMQKCAPA